MHIFNITFQSVSALLAIGVLGFWIIKRHIIPDDILRFLAILAIDIALPCVVFSNIITRFSPSASADWWQYPLWWLIFEAVALVLSLGAMVVSEKTTRGEFALSLFFQNGIFFPLIVLGGIFGPSTPYIPILFIFIAFHPSLFFSTNHLFFRGKRRKRAGDASEVAPGSSMKLGKIINPVLLATMVSATIKLTGTETHLPTFLLSVFQILGGMSLPLLMLILGGSLYMDFQNKGPIHVMEMVKFVVVKNFLFPLVFIALLVLTRPAYPIALIMFLQSAVPPITGIPIQTARQGGNASITNQFILASFIFSIFSLPLMFSLFTRYFPMP
jgi:malate permease and related proteins